jgi:hypothetical protein
MVPLNTSDCTDDALDEGFARVDSFSKAETVGRRFIFNNLFLALTLIAQDFTGMNMISTS